MAFVKLTDQWRDKVEEEVLLNYPYGWLTVARDTLRQRVRSAWNIVRNARYEIATKRISKEDIELIIDRIKLRQRAV